MIALSRLVVTRPLVCIAQRNLVSSVLLTRTWENESVAELKRQAKVRGLSPKGNKATLIQKIQEHDKDSAREPATSRASTARDLSTTTVLPNQDIVPGIPPAPQSTHDPCQSFMVNIPDIPQPDPEFSVQVPYLPDFWDSSVSVGNPQTEESLPKLLVVAGADTHPGGGPSHNLLDANFHHEGVSSPAKSNIIAGQGKIWDDVTEDLGLPYLREMKASLWKSFS